MQPAPELVEPTDLEFLCGQLAETQLFLNDCMRAPCDKLFVDNIRRVNYREGGIVLLLMVCDAMIGGVVK